MARKAREAKAVAPSRGADHEKVKHATFSVSAALFEELGERLVSKPEIALAELIKNAYDADSPDCQITLDDTQIVVADHGHGLTEREFLNNWMVVSSPAKGKQRYSRRFGRAMAGSKGVGRFSARYLGRMVELTTVADVPGGRVGARTKLTATFDWTKIAQAQKIGQVTIDYRVRLAKPGEATGTTLRIAQLRDEAEAISVAQVKTDILRLTDPAAGLERPAFAFSHKDPAPKDDRDPGFTVSFTNAASTPELVAPSVASEILKAFVGRVRIQVTESGRLNYKVFWNRSEKVLDEGWFPLADVARDFSAKALKLKPGQDADERGLPIELEDVSHLPMSLRLHSPVFIDIRFFPRRAGTFSDLPVNGKTAQRWLSEAASLAIVDNGFAMPAYSDRGSDWLGVDASKARNERAWQSVFTPVYYPMKPGARENPKLNPMLALPRGSQLVGRIHITTQKRPADSVVSDDWLQPNMDRESLRSNGAFRLLWHVARFAVELLAHHDRAQRLKLEEKKLRDRQKQARTSLSAAIEEIKSSPNIDPAYRRRVVEQLTQAQEQFAEAAAYSDDAKRSLEVMSMMGVMAGLLTHEFEKSLATITHARELLDKLPRPGGEVTGALAQLRAYESELGHFRDYMRLIVDKARELKPQAFKARAQVNFTAKTLRHLTDRYGITVALDIDGKLPGPAVPVAAYNGIVMNLMTNAMKALIPKVPGEPRRIRLYATNEGTHQTLVCADNGIGIPGYVRTRIWDPLFTTTASTDEDNPLGSGLGLGLSVVKQVVQGLGGRIELLEEAPTGFATAFKVTLPLEAKGN